MLGRQAQSVLKSKILERAQFGARVQRQNTRAFDMSNDIADIRDLSFAHAVDAGWRRWIVRSIEMARGQDRLIPNYLIWRRYMRRHGSKNMMKAAYRLLRLKVDMIGALDPKVFDPKTPLVIVANHPFGIMDGLALLRVAEELGRNYKIIINKELLRVPEFRDLSLPIDFNKTRAATKTNLATKQEAIKRIREGEVIVIFPSGAVATSETPFGDVEELPWHNFTARLIKEGGANVLPIYFHGHNSRLFQLASHASVTLRYAMLVGEFTDHRRHVPLKLTIGEPVDYADIESMDKVQLTSWLNRRVMGLQYAHGARTTHISDGPRMRRKYLRSIKRAGLKTLKEVLPTEES